MSRDEEEDIVSIFEEDELILVTLANGSHLIGEYMFESDAGICLKVTSKTVIVEELGISAEKYQKGKTKVMTMLKDKTFTELVKIADHYKIPVKDVYGSVDPTTIIGEHYGRELYVNALFKHVMAEWEKENRTTKKTMKDLRRTIRTYIPWEKVEQIEAAVEVHEEYELGAFATDGMASGELISDEKWNSIIEEWKKDGN